MDIIYVTMKELKNCKRTSCYRYFGWCIWNKCLVGLLHYCVFELNNISYNSNHFGQVTKGDWIFIFFHRNIKKFFTAFIIKQFRWRVQSLLEVFKGNVGLFFQQNLYLSQWKSNQYITGKTQSCVSPRYIT